MITPKEQLDALLKALGVTEYNAAAAKVTELTTASANATAWQTDRTAMFALLGVQDQPGATAAIDGLFKALNVTSAADALAGVTRMNGDLSARQSTIDTLTTQNSTLTTDLASAKGRIGTLEAAQSGFDEKVQAEVTKQIASAGMPAPIAKVVEQQQNPSATAPRKQSHLQRAIALAEEQAKK